MKLYSYNDTPEEFFNNIEFETITSVNEIIEDVKKSQDGAVVRYSRKFGDGFIDSIEITKDEIKSAYKNVDKKTQNAIQTAIDNVKEFAQKQLKSINELDTEIQGVKLGHKIIPIDTVGCYIPGGNYPLPSTAIMTIVPARTAGVKKVIACSPKAQDITIVACDMAGADTIYRIGGVQAIAAMAYGTETVEKADKI